MPKPSPRTWPRQTRKTPTKADAEPVDCSVCKGAGYVCEECGEPVGECTCDGGPNEVPCDMCGGGGTE